MSEWENDQWESSDESWADSGQSAWAPNAERFREPQPVHTILRPSAGHPGGQGSAGKLGGRGHGATAGSHDASGTVYSLESGQSSIPGPSSAAGHSPVGGHRSGASDPPRFPVAEGYHAIHKRMMKPHPNIPNAAEPRSTWKTPYSYGYFGASGKRHWSTHHGYRDRGTEWRYR